MQTQDEIQRRYAEALDAFVGKVRQDRNILAAILGGSLAYDQVWEKSDIDLLLIGTEEVKAVKDFYLVEDGINIHALLYPRAKFKQALEGTLQSSFFHAFFSKSTLLFSTDETLRDYYQDVHRIGYRDRAWQLLRAGTAVLPSLAKAEKWLYVKRDVAYSFLYVLYTVTHLATVEVVKRGEVAGREVIQQALKHSPDLFRALYTDLIHQTKDEAALRDALERINGYLDEHRALLFQPILDYLTEAGGARSTTEMDAYFQKKVQTESLAFAYEWLADKGVIEKVSTPLRLTEKSRVTVDEAAYYYDGGEPA